MPDGKGNTEYLWIPTEENKQKYEVYTNWLNAPYPQGMNVLGDHSREYRVSREPVTHKHLQYLLKQTKQKASDWHAKAVPPKQPWKPRAKIQKKLEVIQERAKKIPQHYDPWYTAEIRVEISIGTKTYDNPNDPGMNIHEKGTLAFANMDGNPRPDQQAIEKKKAANKRGNLGCFGDPNAIQYAAPDTIPTKERMRKRFQLRDRPAPNMEPEHNVSTPPPQVEQTRDEKLLEEMRVIIRPTPEQARHLPGVPIRADDGTLIPVSQSELPDQYWREREINNLSLQAVLTPKKPGETSLDYLDWDQLRSQITGTPSPASQVVVSQEKTQSSTQEGTIVITDESQENLDLQQNNIIIIEQTPSLTQSVSTTEWLTPNRNPSTIAVEGSPNETTTEWLSPNRSSNRVAITLEDALDELYGKE